MEKKNARKRKASLPKKKRVPQNAALRKIRISLYSLQNQISNLIFLFE